jgi:hypothetical protein
VLLCDRFISDCSGGAEKKRTVSWFLLHDNAPAHRSVFDMDFLAKNKVTAPLHTPDLAPAAFYPLPRQKSALMGRRFCDATDIIKKATDELKRHSPNVFQECFQHLHSRIRKCTVEQETILQ